MKKYLFSLLIVLISTIIFNSCNDKGNNSASKAKDSIPTFSTNYVQLENGKKYLIQDNSSIQDMSLQDNTEAILDVTIPDSSITFHRTINPKDTTCNLLELAKSCVNKYQSSGNRAIRTDYVSFGQKSLAKWINRAKNADSIEFKFGIYTDAFIDAVNHLNGSNSKDDQGDSIPKLKMKDTARTTIFLFAYNFDKQHKEISFAETSKNKLLPAYNLGNLHP